MTKRTSGGQGKTGSHKTRRAGQVAAAGDKTLRSYTVGAAPILNHLLERLDLEAILQRHLPQEDGRTKVPAATGLLLLIRNVLISREPIYGVADWASGYAPDLLGLSEKLLTALNDDRLGRCLAGFFTVLGPELILDVVRQAVRAFDLSLEELHNDSTSISFYGKYSGAAEEGQLRGRPTHAITWGFSKDHRPDLKQLLYILTVTDDGGVPVYFTSASGNVSDDQTHADTWDLLCQLVGSPNFLYVADCKLASTANLDHVARRGGRFVTVLPGTRREDAEFRHRLSASPQAAAWQPLYNVTNLREEGQEEIVDRLSTWGQEQSTSEGYRLLWFHSTRKAELDRATRVQRTERALLELKDLRERLEGPRTRFHERALVEEAAAEILKSRDVQRWVTVRVQDQERSRYRQATPGRPGKDTHYVLEVQTRFTLSCEVDAARLQQEELADGVFPLITNQRQMSAEEVLRAYKRQPFIEKRFSQFKSDFQVAPVYLKEVSRIQGLLGVYFLALLLQTLLERELRRAMQREGVKSLPLYGEQRECQRPTARKILDLFEPIQRHVLTLPDGGDQILRTQLSAPQRQILKLLKIPVATYTE
jgi:transposase